MPNTDIIGIEGLISRTLNVMEAWQNKVAAEISGQGIICGHFLPEEEPDKTYLAMMEF